MNSSREVKFLIAILLFIFLVLLLACKEPIEGCLDVDAINYNVAADNPCADCCNYPGLELQINYQYDTFSFSYDSIYPFEGFDAQFDKIVFYLSDFKLVNETQSLEVIETIDLEEINGGVIIVKDDFVLLSPGRSIRYDIGEIRGGGKIYTTLEFKVGLSAAVTLTDAEAVPEDHPLAFGIDTLWTFPEGYIYNQLTLFPDTTDIDSPRVIDVRGASNLVQVQLPYELEVSRGMQVSLPLRIDFQKWFSGIDFVSFTDDAIIEKIVTNTPVAFSIDD